MAPPLRYAYWIFAVVLTIAPFVFAGLFWGGVVTDARFYAVGAPNFPLNSFLIIPTLVLAVSYWVAAIWFEHDIRKQVESRHRTFRWIAHGIYLPLYIAALAGIVLDDTNVEVGVTIILATLGIGLAYTHSSNEAMNAGAYENKAERTKILEKHGYHYIGRSSIAVEGLLTNIVIFGLIVAGFVILGINYGVCEMQVWLPIAVAGWYLGLIVMAYGLTNARSEWVANHTHARDGFYIAWEVILVLLIHFSVFFAWRTAPVCGP